MMSAGKDFSARLIQGESVSRASGLVVIDCRFSLADPGQGRKLYLQGHVPGAYYLHLDEDLSGPVKQHGGRHPLPDPDRFVARLAELGIGPETQVAVYDDSRMAFAARLWWMMCSIGFKPPAILDGGYQAWLALGVEAEIQVSAAQVCDASTGNRFSQVCDIQGVREAQARGALLIDSREEPRFLGLEEPIDPVAGHIPGAINRPWQRLTSAAGTVGDKAEHKAYLGNALDAPQLVVYCGSGVTACVNVFALALAGREDAILYSGSWSDWCSYLILH
jgi:thiosulfate/3-mercaptopyruvate sulfurtransferase